MIIFHPFLIILQILNELIFFRTTKHGNKERFVNEYFLITQIYKPVASELVNLIETEEIILFKQKTSLEPAENGCVNV